MAERKPRERGVSSRPRILDYIGSGGLEEAEAREFARTAVRHARAETEGRGVEGPAPDAVRERREARQPSREAP